MPDTDITDLYIDPATGAFTTGDDPDRGRRPPRSNARQIADNVDARWAWTVIRIMLAIFAFMTIVWSADYFGSPGLQVVLFFATFVLAVVMAVSAKATIAIFAVGSLLGLAQGRTLFASGGETLQAWWRKGAPGTVLALLLFQGFFVLWPWSFSFGLFWFGIGSGLIFALTMFVYAIPAKWMPYIVLPIAGAAVFFTMAISAIGGGLPQNIAPVDPGSMPLIGNGQGNAPQGPRYASALRNVVGELEPMVLQPAEESYPIATYTDTSVCFSAPMTVRVVSIFADGKEAIGDDIDPRAVQIRLQNQGNVPAEVAPVRKPGKNSC